MILGAHVSIAGGLHNAAAEAASIGADTMQIFCKNQRQWQAKDLSEEEIDLFKTAVASAGLGPVMVHDSYLINMGNPDDGKRENARQAFRRELDRCEQLGIPYLNFHPGSHVHPKKPMRDDPGVRKACLDRIAQCMRQTIDETPEYSTKLVVENAAGQGTNVGTSWEEVGHLVDAVHDPERVGVCIDTQHAWAWGYDWVEEYDGVWDSFDDAVGMKWLVGLHLNDSKEARGARVDRHDNIGDGHLGQGVFARLVQDPRLTDIAGYLETPGGPQVWQKEITLLRSLAQTELASSP